MRTVQLYDHPVFLEHNAGPGHPESPERLKAIQQGLEDNGLYEKLLRMSPDETDPANVYRVHKEPYVERILSLRGQSASLGMETSISPSSVEAALHASGALIEASDAVLDGACDTAFSFGRPPGHHAEYARALGFCFFNHVAVTAARVLAERGLERVLILDPDVHHGNGTQNIFYERSDVMFVSIHQYPFYPGSGAVEETGRGDGTGYTVNIPMSAGLSDPEYLAVTEHLVLPCIEHYRPDMVLISAGFDAHRADPLAMMEVTDYGFRAMFGMIADFLDSHHIPFLFQLEGGYDLPTMQSVVPAVIEDLVHGSYPEPNYGEPSTSTEEIIRKVRYCHEFLKI